MKHLTTIIKERTVETIPCILVSIKIFSIKKCSLDHMNFFMHRVSRNNFLRNMLHFTIPIFYDKNSFGTNATVALVISYDLHEISA